MPRARPNGGRQGRTVIVAAVCARNRLAYNRAMEDIGRKPAGALRRGWTTGACAAAATKAALTALVSGRFPDPVQIRLPKGETPGFALAVAKLDGDSATAGVVKDAGDDPDVTHGMTILATVRRGEPGTGIVFRAGAGVGTVTLPGLPVTAGEPAINPAPRAMIRAIVLELCAGHGMPADIEIEIAAPGGEAIALRTWNPRLGIVGGISILGTTGIVHPYSCSAWIHSIHRGIDVARANGIGHVLGATGSTSEAAAVALHGFPAIARLDMGDFAGGLLKYLRRHPVPKLTLAGGFAKMTKLAQGALDLHSGRSQVDFEKLARTAADLGLNRQASERIRAANTALEALELTRGSAIDLPLKIAQLAAATAQAELLELKVEVEVLIVGRDGALLARHNPL
jgi:cobalt-precorrin-5B (C1)-methyltransferase